MYNSIFIGNTIMDIIKECKKCKKCKEEKDYNPSIMELLKISYICHGWFLGELGKPLFDNDEIIKAYPYGPVAINMYGEFRQRGIFLKNKSNNAIEKTISEKDKNYLKEVVEHYSNLNPFYLSDLTHEKGTPWTETVEKEGLYAVIPNKLIKKYYQKRNR